MINKFIKNNKTIRQTILLFLSQIFSLLISFFINMLIAKEMGPQLFGVYSLVLAIISFVSIFFEFGYFASSGRLLATNKNKDTEKKLIGASLIILIIIAILFIIFIYMLSLIVGNIFNKEEEISHILSRISIISWSFIIPFYLELTLKGANYIELFSVFNFIWKILFMTLIFIDLYLDSLNPTNILSAFSISCIISFILIINRLKFELTSLKSFILKILHEFLRYGRHIYVGRVIDTSTYQLDRLMIGYFSGAKEVGFYSLSNSMSNPIMLFSFSLASSKYKDFVNHKPIEKKIIFLNVLWIISSVLGINLLNYLIVNYYLGEEYGQLLFLTFLMSLTLGFNAAFIPYNFWLDSNGYSLFLKKKAYYTSFTNVVLNFILIPLYGSVGAALASLISMILSFSLHLYYYKKIIK